MVDCLNMRLGWLCSCDVEVCRAIQHRFRELKTQVFESRANQDGELATFEHVPANPLRSRTGGSIGVNGTTAQGSGGRAQ